MAALFYDLPPTMPTLPQTLYGSEASSSFTAPIQPLKIEISPKPVYSPHQTLQTALVGSVILLCILLEGALGIASEVFPAGPLVGYRPCNACASATGGSLCCHCSDREPLFKKVRTISHLRRSFVFVITGI